VLHNSKKSIVVTLCEIKRDILNPSENKPAKRAICELQNSHPSFIVFIFILNHGYLIVTSASGTCIYSYARTVVASSDGEAKLFDSFTCFVICRVLNIQNV